MKNSLSWLLAGWLLFGSTGCIYVRVTGDLDEGFWRDDEGGAGFHELKAAVGTCLADPEYDLDLAANPWRSEAEWTVRYASEGSDGHAAFHKAKEAVLARIEREGGTVTEQQDDGPHSWSCSFRLNGEPCEASVRLVENAGEDDERPHQLEVVWEESD
ncbi:MAG: hypothetical protein HOP15_00280 [Planctomycetes bacterium]|nr:hypothetical protein [Planctomycetota bacterium]